MNHAKHKLYNHEVEPPQNVWVHIEQALDDAGNGQSFPGKLYTARVTPPNNLWNNITEQLENDSYAVVAATLQSAAVTPAAHNWEAIAAALHTDPYQAVGEKLYHTTVAPPATCWEAIATRLPATVTPTQTTTKPKGIVLPFLRFAAAAILIGLTLFGAIKVWGPQSTNHGNEQSLVSTPGVNTQPPAIASTPAINPQVPTKNQATTLTTEARNNIPAVKKAGNNYQQASSNNRIYASNTSENTADRYVAFMTLDGNIVRMSKKMENMICCVTGAEVTDDCKTQLQKWQEKVADAPMSLAPDNLMDIFSLVNTLNEGDL